MVRFSENKVIEHKIVSWSTIRGLSEIFIILRTTERDNINVQWPSYEVPVIHRNWRFLDTFSRNSQIPNFMKIRQVGAELFMRTDERTDMTKLIVAFRSFVNAPKNWTQVFVQTCLLDTWSRVKITKLPVSKLRRRQVTVFKIGRRYACRIGLPILMLKDWRISDKQLSMFQRLCLKKLIYSVSYLLPTWSSVRSVCSKYFLFLWNAKFSMSNRNNFPPERIVLPACSCKKLFNVCVSSMLNSPERFIAIRFSTANYDVT